MLVRWDPFVDSNHFYDRVFRAAVAPETRRRAASWPAVDIHESEDAFSISVEVPGIAREDIAVEIDGGALTVRGERKVREGAAVDRRSERFHGSFSRTFSLPESADADAIEASLHDGVLELKVPKRAPRSVRTIEVKAA